jgi:hypothetical protein
MDTRLDVSELKNACLIVNTAEYCQRTTEEVLMSRFHGLTLADMSYSWKARSGRKLAKAHDHPSRSRLSTISS